MDISKAVKVELDKDERSVAWLARQCDLQRASVHQMINGNPTIKNIQLIAKKLGMSASELIAKAEGY